MRRMRGVVVLAGIGLVMSLGGVAAQGELPPGHVLDNARLDDGNNDPLRGRDIPGMAVDPADPKHVVLIDE
ncbi:MAG: hypothetical protein ACRD12_18475, partial [Acidimicrobiales bacterium]